MNFTLERRPPSVNLYDLLHGNSSLTSSTLLTEEQLRLAGFVHVDHLGWVHRSRKPPQQLLEAFAIAHCDKPEGNNSGKTFSSTFFGDDLFVSAAAEERRPLRIRLVALIHGLLARLMHRRTERVIL